METAAHPDFPPAGRRPVAATRPLATLAHGLLLTGAAVMVFLASGVPQGALGIFLLCAGAALILCPPGVKVDGAVWLAAAGLVAGASLAFLPAHSFPVPGWRAALESLPVVPLRETITPVPWQSAFWLALLASTALLGLFMLAQPIRSSTLLSLALGAAVVCGVYAALAIYAKTTGWHYPFAGGATFGFFPNRNHTATFLVTGGIVAIGVLAVTLRDGRWFGAGLAAICLTTCVAGLFLYSGSRGGIVFLLLGTLLWIGGLGRTHRNDRLLISCVTLLLAGGAFFLLCGGEARARMAAFFERSSSTQLARAHPVSGVDGTVGQAPSPEDEAPFDERVLIYKDTLPLIRAFPLTGTGLGAFAAVFPQYRNASLSGRRAVHPESDWLMLAAEAGLPAVVCLLLLLWLLARRLPAMKEHPYWPVRWACVAAAATAAMHGLVDVPAHHISLGWWIVVLAGLGLQPGRVKQVQRSRLQHALFIWGGVAILVLGTSLVRAQWFGAPPLPPFAAERLQAKIVQAYKSQDITRATRLDREAIFTSPWDETFYYQLGAFELPFSDSDAEVDGAFQAERLLDPGSVPIPLRQGEAWLHYDAAHAAALWLEALSRQQRLDRVAHLGPEASVHFYRDLLGRAAKWPDVQQRLLAGAEQGPEYTLTWLENARPELVHDRLEQFATNDDFVQHLNSDERRRFLLAWYAAGDRGKLAQFINAHQDWQTAAWPLRLQQWVDAGDFERAVKEAAVHYQVSLSLPALSADGTPVEASEQEQPDPVAAFNAFWRNGNTLAADRVLDEAIGNGAHAVPPELWRLKAAEAAQKAAWPIAWQSLRKYIRAVHGADSL